MKNMQLSWENLLVLLKRLGDFKGASEIYKKTLRIFKFHYGESHYEFATILGFIAGFLKRLR